MTLLADPVTVSVPATSANLGPGFDSLGLALDLRDTLTAQAYDGPLIVEVTGEGAADVPRDERHLVVRAMTTAFEAMDRPMPGIRLRCHNVIPHARGLGSSSAAIVAGIALARALSSEADGGVRLGEEAALALANRIEGHPDNVAPAQLGGLTVAVVEEATEVRCARLDPHPSINAVVFVPPSPLETSVARGLLPASVPHADAAANSGRAALLVAALTQRPDLLLPATADLLHQEYRRPAMPESMALVDSLRGDGIAAVVSGAGPSVLALGDTDLSDVRRRAPAGWRTLTPAIGGTGVRLERPNTR